MLGAGIWRGGQVWKLEQPCCEAGGDTGRQAGTPHVPSLTLLVCTGIYEFGNAGGLIVMARHKAEGPTDVIYFSPDHGSCWHRIQLPEAITVDNIRCVVWAGWIGHVCANNTQVTN